MRDLIPPVRRSTLRIGPRLLYGTPAAAVAVICADGFPVGPDAIREVMNSARELLNESFIRRRIGIPRGGWRLILVHPEEYWQDYLSAEVASRVTVELAGESPDAAVAVVIAMTKGRRP
jgi:hypothetical protein